ncbi:MAG: DUF350 domain-containing protein [Oleiphilaceae bacterium]|nr:DUF350 domain-containing protein [Oleiphilaceae bacterium]
MDAIQQSLLGLGNFSLYFLVALLFMLAFKFIYVLVTPHDEWRLVKEDQNVAAATGFVGAVIGFSIALGGAVANSESLLDFAVWGVVGLVAQILAFAIVRFIFMPRIVERINANELSAGIVLGGICVAVGILNAACMTY